MIHLGLAPRIPGSCLEFFCCHVLITVNRFKSKAKYKILSREVVIQIGNYAHLVLLYFKTYFMRLWYFLTQSPLNYTDMIRQRLWEINYALDELGKWDHRGLFAAGIKLKVIAEQLQICGLAQKWSGISVSKFNTTLCSSFVWVTV